MTAPVRRSLLLGLLAGAVACAAPGPGAVEAARAPAAPSSAPAELTLPGGLPEPPTGSRPFPTGRPATAAETQAYAEAVQVLERTPFRVVQRDLLVPHVEVRDEDPRAGLVRDSVVEDDGRVVVTDLQVAGRYLRAVGLPGALGVVRPGERWLAQDVAAPTDSPTLYALDPARHCPQGCPLQVVAPGTYLLLPPSDESGTGSRYEVALTGGRITSFHAWYPEDVGNAVDEGEYASLLLDLPPDAALLVPEPGTVVSVADQAQRAAEQQQQAEQPVQHCGEIVNGYQACVQQAPLPREPEPAVVPPDGVLDAPPLPTG